MGKNEIIANKTALKKWVDEKLKATIYDDILRDTFDYKSVKLMEMPSEAQASDLINWDSIALSPANKTLFKLFERSFAMIEAGKNRSDLFKLIYSFPREDEYVKKCKEYYTNKNLLDLDAELIPLNIDENYAKNFVKCLCGRAKSIKKNKNRMLAANRSRFFIIGDVGIGKTTFLNYIFSCTYKYLEKMSVMWIRVDLTKPYLSSLPLNEAINFQLARVAREHYEKSIIDKYFAEISDYVHAEFKKLIENNIIEMKRVDDYIMEYLEEFDPERPEPYNPVMQRGIKRLIEEKYSMIYVIDGLDKLRPGNDFNEKLVQIQKYIIGSKKTKHVYLLVMRNMSHAKLLHSYLTGPENETLASLRQVAKTFVILPPKLRTVVENRIELLIKKWREFLEEEKDDIIVPCQDVDIFNVSEDQDLTEHEKKLLPQLYNSAEWINKDIIGDYYDIFLRFIYRGLTLDDIDNVLKDWDRDRAYRCLKDLVGTNFRNLLQALTRLQKAFIGTIQLENLEPIDVAEMGVALANHDGETSQKFENAKAHIHSILGKYYRAMEVLFGSPNLYSHPYEYQLDENNMIKLEHSIKVSSKTYLYNIFKGANVGNMEEECYNLLSKIRIIQQLCKKGELYEDKIINKINKRFGYPKTHLRIDLQELLYINYIKQSPVTSVDESEYSYQFLPSRIGITFLEKFISENIYLRSIINDILVPVGLEKNFQDPKLYNFDTNRRLWSISQMPRVARFISLIREIERQEKEHFKESYPPEDFEYYKISDKIAESFMDTCRVIISTSPASKFESIYSIFSRQI